MHNLLRGFIVLFMKWKSMAFLLSESYQQYHMFGEGIHNYDKLKSRCWSSYSTSCIILFLLIVSVFWNILCMKDHKFVTQPCFVYAEGAKKIASMAQQLVLWLCKFAQGRR